MPDKEKHGIEVTHEGYDKFIADWMDCRSVLDGGRAVKAATERFCQNRRVCQSRRTDRMSTGRSSTARLGARSRR